MFQGVIMKIEINKKFDSDDLIYNRFDLIFYVYEQFMFEWENEKYSIMIHQENDKLYINLWGKELPQKKFEELIDELFVKKDVRTISIIRCRNNYNGMLEETNDIMIFLPQSAEELKSRLQQKHRYNLKREKRILNDVFGEMISVHYSRREISDEMVNLYFRWKKESHGTSYKLTAEEYLDAYHVTDAFVLNIDKQMIGIAFYCVVNNVAYFENFSYDSRYKEYSVGYITYEMLLENLIEQKIEKFFLGGGDYDYKRRFGAIESVAYSGHIYSKNVFMTANDFLSDKLIKNVVIYGLGKYGNEFIRLVNTRKIRVKIIGAIDKNRKEIANIHTYTLVDDFPEADAAIITLKNKNNDVEELLRDKYENVVYMNDLLGV